MAPLNPGGNAGTKGVEPTLSSRRSRDRTRGLATRSSVRRAGRRLRRDVRAGLTLTRTTYAVLRLVARRPVDAAEHVALATQLLATGQSRLPIALLDRAERSLGPSPAVTRLRRSAPRYVGRVSARRLRTVASEVAGRRVGPGELHTLPVEGGRSWATVTIVRHVVQPEGRTFIRKTLHRGHPREARLYASGMVALPGRGWRAPSVIGVYHTAAHWHVFLEDLGAARRPRSQAEFVAAARALGELAAGFRALPVAESWMRPVTHPRLATYELKPDDVRRLLPPELAERLLSTFRRLRAHEIELVVALRRRPTTLCHGDSHAGNLVIDPSNPGGIVLIDWGFAQVGPVGADLGDLLSVPYLTAGRRSHDPDACLSAYLDALALDPEGTEHARQAYRHQLVFRSFRWWAARSRSRSQPLREPDVTRICDAADVLLHGCGG